MTQESMEYPVFRALMDEAHGVTEGAMLPFIPEEDADTRAAWAKVGALLEKHVSGLEAQAEIEDAIIEHEQAAVWLAYKNGIRVALELQEELRKIAAPATPGGVMAAAAGAGDLQRGDVAASAGAAGV